MTPTPSQRVLVIEDDGPTREMLRWMLEDAGYIVEEAPDGAPALARLRESQNQLVALLDLLMPRVDGLHVLEAAAIDALIGRHAFILLTADSRLPSPDLSDLLTRLQVPIVWKPFDLVHLLEIIAAAAERLA